MISVEPGALRSAMAASVACVAACVRYMTTPSQIQHVGDERSCPARSRAVPSASRSKSIGTKVRNTRALVALRGGVVHLEHLHTGELRQPPGASVVARAEDDELPRTRA